MMQEMIPLITQYGLALVFANTLRKQVGLPIPATPGVHPGASAAQRAGCVDRGRP